MEITAHAIKAVALGLVASTLPSRAEGDSSPTFKFSGFGTLAVVRSSEDKADFIPNFALPNGAGYTRSTDFGADSRLGLQVDWKISSQFSAVVQGISEHRYDDTYKPYLNMANLKWEFSPGYAFRVGRVPYSAYLISDYQKVGYPAPWVRPPVEVYQFNPLTFVDGADFSWQTNIGDLALSGQFLGGTSTVKLAPSWLAVQTSGGASIPDSEWKGENLGAAGLGFNYGHATFRLFYLQMKGTYSDAGFDGTHGPFYALRHLPAAQGGNPALADQYQIQKDLLAYQSAAFQYDPGGWFFITEATRKSGDENMLLNFTSGYATLGVRFGSWTPYVTAASKHTTSPLTHSNPIINQVLAKVNRAQTSYSAGLRWDFHTNMALKAQYDRVTNAVGSDGSFTNLQPTFKPGQSYNLSTLAIDFVF